MRREKVSGVGLVGRIGGRGEEGSEKALRAYVEFIGRDEVGGVGGIAEGGGDVEGRSYVRGAVEVVVGVDGLGCGGQGPCGE